MPLSLHKNRYWYKFQIWCLLNEVLAYVNDGIEVERVHQKAQPLLAATVFEKVAPQRGGCARKHKTSSAIRFEECFRWKELFQPEL